MATTVRTEAEEIAELGDLLADNKGVEPLRDFITDLVPMEPPPEHTRVLTDLVERARNERVMACISWPPRHAKTVTMLRSLAWWIKHAKADTCAYVSYSDTQARSKSRLCRNWALQAGVELMRDSKNMGEWRTAYGGGLISGGAGGGLTGQGVSGLMIVDDPYKNRAEVDSTLIRERIWEWFNEVVYTGLEKASVFTIATRWHEDDLIGRLGASGGWEVINLPAIAEVEDPLGRLPGEPLWPDRFPLTELESIRKQQGDFSFASLYQGRPRPKGSNVFNTPNYYDREKLDLTGCRVVIGADPAASEKTSADYSVAIALAVRGHGPTSQAYVLDVFRGQVTVPAFVNELRRMSEKHWHAAAAVEAVGGFAAIPQMLKQLDPALKLIPVSVRGDKFTRSQAVAAAWNDGRVLVPQSAPWLKEFLEEVDLFTGVNDRHDDQVDSLAHAFNSLAFAPKPVFRGAVADPSRWR